MIFSSLASFPASAQMEPWRPESEHVLLFWGWFFEARWGTGPQGAGQIFQILRLEVLSESTLFNRQGLVWKYGWRNILSNFFDIYILAYIWCLTIYLGPIQVAVRALGLRLCVVKATYHGMVFRPFPCLLDQKKLKIWFFDGFSGFRVFGNFP